MKGLTARTAIVLTGIVLGLGFQSQRPSSILSSSTASLDPSTEKASVPFSEKLVPPSLAVLQREASKRPHHTPESLIQFAGALADQLKLAIHSKERAELLFADLRDCVLSYRYQTTPVTQALCLDTAGHLARAHSELHPAYQQLLKRAPRDIVELAGTVGYEIM